MTKIRVGDQNLKDSSDDDLAKTYEVKSIIKHDMYNGQGPRNDLAIVFTKTDIEFNAKVQKIKLPEAISDVQDKYADKYAKMLGWGMVDQNKQPSDSLQVADFKVFTTNFCTPKFRNQPVKKRLQEMNIFCSGSEDISAWTCPGDSGSPLVRIENGNEAKAIGILHGSNHTTCTKTTFQSPSLFANLEYEENFEFIRTWVSIGYFMSAYNDNSLFHYLDGLDPNAQIQDLWIVYPSNEEIYASILSGRQKNPKFNSQGKDQRDVTKYLI